MSLSRQIPVTRRRYNQWVANETLEDFARRLLQPPYRTFVLPGAAYDQPNHIRLGVGGSDWSMVEMGLERLAKLLRDWPG